MKRLYTVEEYWEMLHRSRERIPGVAVSSDFIVGFCGESDASFQKSMDIVDRAKFKNSFIFKYSERPGTKAAERFPDDVPDDVKKQRNHDLLMLQNERSLEDSRAMIGKAVEVLVEGPSRQGAKSAPGGIRQLIGRTMTDHIAVFDGPDRLVGEILTVDIAEASGFTLYGAARTGEVIGGEGAAPSRLPRRMGLSLV